MTLYINNKISDYWDKSNFVLKHEIIKYINKNWFQELYIRVQLIRIKANGPYIKVNKVLL